MKRALTIAAVADLVIVSVLLHTPIRDWLWTHPWTHSFLVAVPTIALAVIAFVELRHSEKANELREEANRLRGAAINLQQEANELREQRITLSRDNSRLTMELDAERNKHLQQIAVKLDDQLRTKVTALETAENERKKKVADQKKFGLLMEEGRNLYGEIARLRGEDLETWDARLTGWQTSVRVALDEINFPADYHEFTRATDEIEPVLPVGDVKDLRWKQEVRRRKLQKQQQKLEEIVQRRLP
jgi:FtsZ-binding cell division protein ZapB